MKVGRVGNLEVREACNPVSILLGVVVEVNL
jgi:hypothetical protein